MDADISWIREQLDSIQAQLRSITATINSNTNHHGQKLVELATRFDAHEREDGLKHAALQDANAKQDVEIQKLGDALDPKVKDSLAYDVAQIKKMEQQAEGAVKVWRVGGALGAALLAALELYHLFGGK